MQKVIIATVLLLSVFFTDATAQNRRGDRNGRRMSADSTRPMLNRLREMEPVTQADLPASVMPHIRSTYPNAEVRRTAKDKEGNFYIVLLNTDKTRRLLIADSKGAIVRTREMPAQHDRQGGKSRRGAREEKSK